MSENIGLFDDFGDKELLQQTGIIPLTSESDGTNMRRFLCDLTEEGCDLVEDYYGRCLTITRGTQMNSIHGQVACIMLTGSAMRELLVYSFVRKGWHVWRGKTLYHGDNAYIYLNPADSEAVAQAQELIGEANLQKGVWFAIWGREGTRNTHQFTGRKY